MNKKYEEWEINNKGEFIKVFEFEFVSLLDIEFKEVEFCHIIIKLIVLMETIPLVEIRKHITMGFYAFAFEGGEVVFVDFDKIKKIDMSKRVISIT